MDRDLKEILKEAKRDNVESKMKAARHYEDTEQYKEAFQWYSDAANEGQPVAQLKVANYYFEGKGVKRDYSKACSWYLKASVYNNAEALSKLADLYKEGLGTDVDLNESFNLYTRAAEAGDVDAKYNLGVIYRDGIIEQKNDEKASKNTQSKIQNG